MERYELSFNDEVRREFLSIIQKGKSTPVVRQSLRVTVHDVPYRDEVYRVVFDTHRHEIVTFLMPDWTGMDELSW